jgi:hypothetical protein
MLAAGPIPVPAVLVGAVSVPLVLAPNPAAALAALPLVVPSLPAADLVVAGTRCPPSRRSGPAQSKGSGLPSGYRPIADRSPGKATLQSNHNDNAVKCTMPEGATCLRTPWLPKRRRWIA